MKKILLIDGNPIMHRAYHAIPPFRTDKGTPTNIVYGFISMINKIYNDFKPEYLAVVFDTPKPTFRNKIFKEYQIQRPKIEDDFIIQIPLVKEALDLGKIYRIEKDGYEADDVIGTLSQIFTKNQYQVIILSADKDILQLVNDQVFVASPQVGFSNIKIFDPTEVKMKLNVEPSLIPDFKALAGDSSDNYPGAKGIGEKTAIKLINDFGPIEKIYENLEKIIPYKIKEILIREKDNVFLSKKLAKIILDVPIEVDLEKMRFSGFNKRLKEFLEKYQMFSLVKRLFNEKKPEEKKDEQVKLF